MNTKKLLDLGKLVLTAIFMLVLLAGQSTPATADDNGIKTVHVSYVKGKTPNFGNGGVAEKVVPADQLTTTPLVSGDQAVDEPKAKSEEIPVAPSAALTSGPGDWQIIKYEGWEFASLPGALGWTVASLNGSDICWDDVSTGVGALTFNGVWSVWPSAGCTNGLTPNGFGGIYKNSIETSLTYGPFSLAGYTDAALGFMLNNVTETNFDYFCYSVSPDNLTFDGECLTGTTNGWIPINISLARYKGDTSVWFEFYFYSDGSNGDQGPFVDDIFLLGKHTLSFNSSASQDGWILETSETSEKGGTLDAVATTLRVGDGPGDKQYKSIVSFNTASIPDTATITQAVLRVRVKNIVGNVAAFGFITYDIRKPKFGTSILLQGGDFQAPADALGYGANNFSIGNGWLVIHMFLPNTYINKTGPTQLRLRLLATDNDDLSADYYNIYSGNAGAMNAPKLIVDYTLP
jgi:hypothetical protein